MRNLVNIASGALMTGLFALMFWSQIGTIVATALAGPHPETSVALPQIAKSF